MIDSNVTVRPGADDATKALQIANMRAALQALLNQVQDKINYWSAVSDKLSFMDKRRAAIDDTRLFILLTLHKVEKSILILRHPDWEFATGVNEYMQLARSYAETISVLSKTLDGFGRNRSTEPFGEQYDAFVVTINNLLSLYGYRK